MPPFITIITSTYNAKLDLPATIDSVRNIKDRFSVEWVIVDGMSTDGTYELIQQNSELFSTIICEPDTGIYNAWNKASKHITGEWVIFLGAGDKLLLDNFAQVIQELRGIDSQKHKIVYGNVFLVDSYKNVLRKYSKNKKENFSSGRPFVPCHQGVFQHRSLFGKETVFDESYKIVADAKLLLSCMKNSEVKFINYNIAEMLSGGVSTSYAHIIDIKREIERCNKELDIKIPFRCKFFFNLRCYVKFCLYSLLGYTKY